jgi:predicted regulator of Ras-like GTPase activity (Roadblock/LC7/MglB family)
MLARMDAAQAIADLTEISPQVRQVAILDRDGNLAGSNAPHASAERLAAGARRLLEEADSLRGVEVAQLEAATTAGSVFVVRDRGHVIAATTAPEPTVGLVFYDLKTCVRATLDADAPQREAGGAAA